MLRKHFIQKLGYLSGGLSVSPSILLSNNNDAVMNDKIHQFTIGDFQAYLLHDTQFTYKGADFFSNVDPDQAAKELANYHQSMDKIPSPYLSLLLVREDQKILIDTGLGFRSEPVEFKGMKIPIEGKMRARLGELNISEDSITDVILTHLHPDHIGGVCDEHLQPIFSRANHHIHQHEWDYWYGTAGEGENPFFKSFVQQNIDPLHKDQLNLIARDEHELLPGIVTIKVPGHTPGQIAVRIESKGQKLLFISDVWIHPLHIKHTDWQTIYDLDHDLAKASRIKLLEMAYEEDMSVQSFHFQFPGLGHIDKTTSGWKWVPVF